MTTRRPIVAGVDGSESSLQAVSWAAREAALRNAPLTLVTTMFVPPGAHGMPVGVPASFFEEEELECKARLVRAEEVATRAVPGHTLEIDTAFCMGAPSGELVERSKSALMVVVGANRHGIIDRTVLGSVSAAVVTHAHAPVAVVRDLPHTEINDVAGPVVVGVDGSADSEPAISAAFEEAALRQVELVAVHAWSDVELHAPFPSDVDWTQVESREGGAPVREPGRSRRGLPRRAGSAGRGHGPTCSESARAGRAGATPGGREPWSRWIREPAAGLDQQSPATHGDVSPTHRPFSAPEFRDVGLSVSARPDGSGRTTWQAKHGTSAPRPGAKLEGHKDSGGRWCR